MNSQGHAENNRGSALVISLIVMAILLTLSLGVSDLMLGTLRNRRALIDQMKAWYAAESGLEHALREVAENAPGFEIERGGLLASSDAKYTYRIISRAPTIPAKKNYEIKIKEDEFALLPLNQSVVIPLFDQSTTVKGFRVEFFIPPFLQGNTAALSENLDILRWKIFGVSKKDGVTDVLNEFSPMQLLKNSAHRPSCIGTDADCWNGVDKFYERYIARNGSTEVHIVENYLISTFLEQHTNNFLALTNVVNVDLIAGSLTLNERKSIANIRYRVIAPKDQQEKPIFTLPFIHIAADGKAGSAKQSIDIALKRETFLPVFNYALYRTK